MRYLYNTDVKSINQTDSGDMFIVTMVDAAEKYSKTLMDNLGRICDFSYQDIEKRLFDEFFEAKIDTFDYAIIDKTGREIIRYKYRDEVYSFNDGIAVFKSHEANRSYFLSESGELLGQEFEDVEGFFNGTGSVKLLNGKYVLVDREMKIISPEFDYVAPFINEKYTYAEIQGKTCIIDRNFNVVSDKIVDKNGNEEPYSIIFDIDDNDIIIHQKKFADGKTRYCYASIDGKQLGEYHSMVAGFSDGISRVFDENVKGSRYVDLSGEYITENAYINCGNFHEGFAVVGAFDKNGEFIFAFLKKDGTLAKFDIPKAKQEAGFDGVWFPFASDFSEGAGLVMFDGNRRYPVTHDGKVLKGSMLLESRHSGFASYQTKSKKRSFVDSQNQSFKTEFDSVGHFKKNLAVVSIDGRVDAVSVSEMLLSTISQIAEEIEKNPKYIIMLPKEVFKDRVLVLSLLDLAEEVAMAQNNVDYLAAKERIRKNILSQVEESSKGKNGLGE